MQPYKMAVNPFINAGSFVKENLNKKLYSSTYIALMTIVYKLTIAHFLRPS